MFKSERCLGAFSWYYIQAWRARRTGEFPMWRRGELSAGSKMSQSTTSFITWQRRSPECAGDVPSWITGRMTTVLLLSAPALRWPTERAHAPHLSHLTDSGQPVGTLIYQLHRKVFGVILPRTDPQSTATETIAPPIELWRMVSRIEEPQLGIIFPKWNNYIKRPPTEFVTGI